MASHDETRHAARPTSARTHQSDHPTSHLARTHEIHVKCLILNSKKEKNAPQVELRQETKKMAARDHFWCAEKNCHFGRFSGLIFFFFENGSQSLDQCTL
jgi:hypothetical protein